MCRNLDYATRAILRNSWPRAIAIRLITEKWPSIGHDERALFQSILHTYRHIAEHGPNACDILLEQDAARHRQRAENRATLRAAFLRATA